jgi:hypothetical protein
VILKYQAQIDDVEDCPESCDPSARNCDAYRIVHSELSHKNNSLPTAVIDPSLYPPDHEMHCYSWALSVFASKEQAEAKFNKCIRARQILRERIGNHLAVAKLTADDGLVTKPANSGHFSFFEFETFDFSSRFSILGKI